MQFISDHLFNNVCKADFYCSLYRITCLLTFVKQISTAVYIGSLVNQSIRLIVHTINFSRCSFDAFTSITALHVYISAFFINMFYRPQHVVITYKAWSFNTIVFKCNMQIDVFEYTNNEYLYVLYTHQCTAQNTGHTEQWNTNQQITFSESLSCLSDV